MSDGIPKSRVSLTYDTKQPAGREKPRELPFRLMVLGDLGGPKDLPFDQRNLRQLNGRNFGEVLTGLKVRLADVPLDEAGERKVNVLIDSLSSFAPDNVLRLITGQKADGDVDASLKNAWGEDDAKKLWAGDPTYVQRWAQREKIVNFQKSYQNSKTLRMALKKFSGPPVDDIEKSARNESITKLKAALATKLGTAAPGAAEAKVAGAAPEAPAAGGDEA